MAKIPETKLGLTDKTIPLIGLGTADYPFATGEETKQALLEAIKVGYRHFDTASLYFSEQALGEAIAQALDLGLIKSRDELFITSKLWSSNAHGDLVVPALKTSLSNLGLEYIDLYLIHYPVTLKEEAGIKYPFEKEHIVEMDYESVWEAMEECQKLGLTKSIGVSNFSCKKLEKLLSVAKIPPAVNQVEMNPLWQQRKLREFCKEKGILITAYSPLGANGKPWGTPRVMDSPILKQIAQAKHKSLAQICLRWAYEQGVGVIVKSYNKERMGENVEIFDWELSPEEVKQIEEEIPQARGNPAEFFVYENGPFKSIEEFWDGEI